MTFSPGPAMIDGRRGFTLTTLADGSLLAIGGEARNDRGERYRGPRDRGGYWALRPGDAGVGAGPLRRPW